jgi:ATP-dependent helicase/nuclease subunit B
MIQLRENSAVQIRFLLGPAGTGKTFRCLEEIRAELKRAPEGPPLLFLAPKQATFQIERQLLADDSLPGYMRLHILSFDRLADFLLTALGQPPPRLLNDEGRVMVLRALLARHHDQLQLFRASARLPGFALQLSGLLRELQRACITPAALDAAAASHPGTPLARKLADVAWMFREYLNWLAKEKLEDADRLLEVATRQLSDVAQHAGTSARFGGLWLDGFAEMTEQELALLRAVVPWCAGVTLAFCCEAEALEAREGFSHWSVVAQTARRCHSAIATVTPNILTVPLKREPRLQRFSAAPELAHLEAHWGTPESFPGSAAEKNSVRVLRAATPEAEVTFAAREILTHVRAGGRFRDIGVLMRHLDPYQDILRRVFARYEIPFFLDRREPIAHHPLAELTRHAVRTVIFGWKQEDWFGLLKSGLAGAPDLEIDWLENEALARGWEGQTWLEPIQIPEDAALAERLEALRQRTVTPLKHFQTALASAGGGQPTGLEFAAALRELWRAFRVNDQLDAWAEESSDNAVHATVWDQMEQWLQTLALGFAHQRVALRDWLPILEAGLMGLTVGVIPPALDQVLLGSIDRSRNPDLHTVFLLGVNEGVFPAPPSDPVLLTEADRAKIEASLRLGSGLRQQLAHERFYGYIACTRARHQLYVSFSDADRLGRKLTPSAFIAHLQRLFPKLVIEPAAFDETDVRHASELIAPLLRAHAAGDASAKKLIEAPQFLSLRRLADTPVASTVAPLSEALVSRLYPSPLVTSVSRLEEFAACRFRFFVTVGLRAKERLRHEVDARHTGTFQHEVLKEFHETVRKDFGRWHNLDAHQARQLIREIAERLRPHFKNGVLLSTERNRVESGNLINALEDFIETIVDWMGQYEFEPAAAELKFGGDGPLPAWALDLDGGRKLAFTGTMDRVDLLVDAERRVGRVVVMDYKSSARKIDTQLLAGGVQLQLFAYLAALRRLPSAAQFFGVEHLEAAGVFYLSLRGTYKATGSRDDALAHADEARRTAYQHRGRFVQEMLPQFDREASARGSGDQFSFRLKKDGGLYATSTDPVAARTFHALLDGVEQQLVAMGNAIFSGDIRVNPYRHGNKTPCEYCDYAGVCRIDRWTHEFRALPAPPET